MLYSDIGEQYVNGSHGRGQNILEGYEDRIVDHLNDEEELNDVAVAVRMLAQARAISRNKKSDREEKAETEGEKIIENADIEWALGAWCFPLWPKPRDIESAAQTIRPAIVGGIADHEDLPAEIPEDFFASRSPTLLDLMIESPTGGKERIKTLLKRYSPEAIAWHINYRRNRPDRYQKRSERQTKDQRMERRITDH